MGQRERLLNAQRLKRLSGQRLLLCEDSKLSQVLMRKILEGAGCKVDVAGNGAEGLTLAAQYDYALVLMDLVMPVMGGLEATQKIHQLKPDLPVIAMTGATDMAEIQKCLEAGMLDFLAKPVEPEALFKVLELFLGAPAVK